MIDFAKFDIDGIRSDEYMSPPEHMEEYFMMQLNDVFALIDFYSKNNQLNTEEAQIQIDDKLKDTYINMQKRKISISKLEDGFIRKFIEYMYILFTDYTNMVYIRNVFLFINFIIMQMSFVENKPEVLEDLTNYIIDLFDRHSINTIKSFTGYISTLRHVLTEDEFNKLFNEFKVEYRDEEISYFDFIKCVISDMKSEPLFIFDAIVLLNLFTNIFFNKYQVFYIQLCDVLLKNIQVFGSEIHELVYKTVLETMNMIFVYSKPNRPVPEFYTCFSTYYILQNIHMLPEISTDFVLLVSNFTKNVFSSNSCEFFHQNARVLIHNLPPILSLINVFPDFSYVILNIFRDKHLYRDKDEDFIRYFKSILFDTYTYLFDPSNHLPLKISIYALETLPLMMLSYSNYGVRFSDVIINLLENKLLYNISEFYNSDDTTIKESVLNVFFKIVSYLDDRDVFEKYVSCFIDLFLDSYESECEKIRGIAYYILCRLRLYFPDMPRLQDGPVV